MISGIFKGVGLEYQLLVVVHSRWGNVRTNCKYDQMGPSSPLSSDGGGVKGVFLLFYPIFDRYGGYLYWDKGQCYTYCSLSTTQS